MRLYCSKTCRVTSLIVHVRRGGRTVKTIHYKYTKKISMHRGVLYLQLKRISPGVRLVLTLIAVSPTGERSKAKTATRLTR